MNRALIIGNISNWTYASEKIDNYYICTPFYKCLSDYGIKNQFERKKRRKLKILKKLKKNSQNCELAIYKASF